jgi:anti-anti-sigma factor
MEIGISKKGDLQILTAKGKIRLQHWRVLDKHLETMRANGGRWVALDLSEVSLICSTGIGAIIHNIRKFQESEASLMLVAASPYMQEVFQTFGWESFLGQSIFTDWRSLEKRLRSQGLALTGP